MPHGRHIYAKAYDIANGEMYAYPQSDHALPHCNCAFRYCANCPYINIPDQETDNQYSDTTPSIQFPIYHKISRSTAHDIITLKDKKICRKCKQ